MNTKVNTLINENKFYKLITEILFSYFLMRGGDKNKNMFIVLLHKRNAVGT